MLRRLRILRLPAIALMATGVAALMVTAGACGGEETDPAALDGTGWKLMSWSESAQDPDEFTITASFADGRVGGTSAVNSYGGQYTTGPGEAFSTGEIASTMMAGPEPAMRAEQTYLELLGAAATYELAGDTLTLFDEFGDEALVFAPAEE
jgi:heat shock protein HslJ